MDETLLQFLGPSAIAYIIVREFLIYLGKKKSNGAGDKSVEFWQKEMYDAAKDAIRDCMGELTNDLRDRREESSRLREQQHRENTALLQQIINKLDNRRLR